MSVTPELIQAFIKQQAKQQAFMRDYSAYAQALGLAPDPFDPKHFYDYMGAWEAGELKPDGSGHLSSRFKLPGHPRTYLKDPDDPNSPASAKPVPGWTDTRTMRKVPDKK